LDEFDEPGQEGGKQFQQGKEYHVWVQLADNFVPTRRSIKVRNMPEGILAQDAICTEQESCVVSVLAQKSNVNAGFSPEAVYSCLYSAPGGGCVNQDSGSEGKCSYVTQARVVNSTMLLCSSEIGLAAARTVSSVTHLSVFANGIVAENLKDLADPAAGAHDVLNTLLEGHRIMVMPLVRISQVTPNVLATVGEVPIVLETNDDITSWTDDAAWHR
jgi:hypothetical protein